MESTQITINVSSSLTSKDYNDTLYSQLSDDSYINMEQDCRDEIEFEDLLGSQEIPDLNDTLDEINFILELGNKLNLEGKLRTPNSKTSVKDTKSCHSFKTARSAEKFEEVSTNLNKTEEVSGISFLIEKSEILELNRSKKSLKPLIDTTANFADVSESEYFADMSENSQANKSNDTVLMEDSWVLDATQQPEDESYFNSFMSEHGSIDEQSDEDEDCSELSLKHEATVDPADISEIDLTDETLDDSVIEILDD